MTSPYVAPKRKTAIAGDGSMHSTWPTNFGNVGWVNTCRPCVNVGGSSSLVRIFRTGIW